MKPADDAALALLLGQVEGLYFRLRAETEQERLRRRIVEAMRRNEGEGRL